VSDLERLADDVATLEARVTDAVFDAVRSQMRGENAEAARELERRLAKVRRSLQKAEHLLRHGGDD
jgi:hypothetical protein